MSRGDLQQGHRAHQNLSDSTGVDEPCFPTAATLVNRGHVEKCLCILVGKHEDYKLSNSAQEKLPTKGIVAPDSLPSHWSFPVFKIVFTLMWSLCLSSSPSISVSLCVQALDPLGLMIVQVALRSSLYLAFHPPFLPAFCSLVPVAWSC